MPIEIDERWLGGGMGTITVTTADRTETTTTARPLSDDEWVWWAEEEDGTALLPRPPARKPDRTRLLHRLVVQLTGTSVVRFAP